MPTYKIDREPWIPCVGVDGALRHVSLAEVFADATRIASLSGSPLDVAAITRLLLAIAHLVQTPKSLQDWHSLWAERHAFLNRCREYVESQGDVWDLFHAVHPFGQQVGLNGTDNPAYILIYEAARKNNPLLIDHRVTASAEFVPAPDLARGLITANAYAGSSGGGYRSGPLAMRTVAFLQGSNLADTLLLNLLLQDEPPAPVNWSQYGSRSKDSRLDIVRRYLWASRSVLLLAETDMPGAREIKLAPGNELPEEERSDDPMVAFRLSSDQKQYVPLRLEANRALWRSAHVLLNWHSDVKRIAAVVQFHRLLRRGLVASDQSVSVRVCAVAGDAQGPTTEMWRDETLLAGISVFEDDERFAALTNAVNSAEEIATKLRGRIFGFAKAYLQGGSDSQPDKRNVASLADELSPDLEDFWSTVAPAGERVACDDFDESAWTTLLQRAARNCFHQAVERLPPSARRYRAQFHVKQSDDKKTRKKGTTA